MRSLRYMLLGCLHNLDDCIDFATKEKPKSVSLDLEFHRFIGKFYVIRELFGTYRWIFPNKEIELTEQYGCFLSIENQRRQKNGIDCANQKLEVRIEKIKESGIKIKGDEKRFDYSLIYK